MILTKKLLNFFKSNGYHRKDTGCVFIKQHKLYDCYTLNIKITTNSGSTRIHFYIDRVESTLFRSLETTTGFWTTEIVIEYIKDAEDFFNKYIRYSRA